MALFANGHDSRPGLTLDRLIVVLALLIVVGMAWAYLFAGAGMSMMERAVWTPGYAVLMFFMWSIMMIAMMLPSAAPMILVFARVNRQQHEDSHAYLATSAFTMAYLVTWAAFSLIATLLQWALESRDLITPMLVSSNVLLSAGILIAAGIYQLTPLKQACLRQCQSPVQFISQHWRPGLGGALRMGVIHGAFCVVCCWFLMAILFVGGVMNLYWIAGIALFVLLEKTVPAGHWATYATGIALIAWGGVTLVSGVYQ